MAEATEKKSAKKPEKKASAGGSGKKKAKPVEAAGPPRQPGVERRQNHPTRSHGGYMQVLLTQNVAHVGKAGDLVKVRPGFARNFLLPQGMAAFATPHNLKIIEKNRKRLLELEAAQMADLRNLAAQIARKSIRIEANANAEGYLYGSVNADQIAAALKAERFPVDADNVRIEGPLKELGQYMISLHLGHDIATEFELWVVPPHEDVQPAHS